MAREGVDRGLVEPAIDGMPIEKVKQLAAMLDPERRASLPNRSGQLAPGVPHARHHGIDREIPQRAAFERLTVLRQAIASVVGALEEPLGAQRTHQTCQQLRLAA